MTRGDLVIVLLVLVTSLAGMAWWSRAPEGALVVVTANERIVFTAPLGDTREVSLHGPLGESVLRMSSEGAQIVQAPCPLKVCMGMGPAHRTGDLLACLPNRILVEIKGLEEEGPYDLLSR
jgi:hypothetical protein